MTHMHSHTCTHTHTFRYTGASMCTKGRGTNSVMPEVLAWRKKERERKRTKQLVCYDCIPKRMQRGKRKKE